MAIANVVGYYLGLQKKNTMLGFHIISVVEILFYLKIFKDYFSLAAEKKAITIIQYSSPIIAIAFAYYLQPIYNFNQYFQIFEYIVVLSLSIKYFFRIFNFETDSVRTPIFWYVSSLFIYFTGNAIMFTSFELGRIVKEETGINIWIINSITSLLLVGGFVKGLSLEAKKEN